MNQKQLDAFEKCLELLAAGVALEECVKRYPEFTPAMQDLLVHAKNLYDLGDERIPTELMERSRKNLLTKAKSLRTDQSRDSGTRFTIFGTHVKPLIARLPKLAPLSSRLLIILGLTTLLILFSSGLVIASAKSLPGDSLYPVKRAVEDIRIHIVPIHDIRLEYENNYSHQRVVEVRRLIELERVQQISFEGILESIAGNIWMVSGIPVSINSNTTILSGLPGTQSIETGSVIEVEGKTGSQDWVTANEIHLREYLYIGTVEKVNKNNWQISGNEINITSGTQIDPDIREGDDVTILLRSEDNGLYALALLHNIRVSPTPFLSSSSGSKLAGTNQTISNEEHQINGTLEKITEKYWIISGEIMYVIDGSVVPDDIKIGTAVSVNYQVEANGSYTVIKIDKTDIESLTQEYIPQETPEINDKNEGADNPSMTATYENDHGDDSQTPEHHETPQPTDDD